MAETKKSLPSNDRLRDKNCLRKNDLTQLLADPTPNVKTKPDYLPECLKRPKDIYPKKLEWRKAVCPVCRKEYQYLPDHRPQTCGMFECLYAKANERLKEKEAKSNENNL